MNLHGLPADQLQIINPFMVIFLSLFFFSPFWAWADKRRVVRSKPPLAFTQKMKAGFVLMIVASLFLAFSGLVSTEAYKPSCVWQMVAIALMTVAELCVATIGLESAFNEAPKHLQSSLTGIFLAMIFLGNILASALMPIYAAMNPSSYFFLMAGITAVGLLVMSVLSVNFERKKREQFCASARATDADM
jgi:dipeptide/tripeptide permease